MPLGSYRESCQGCSVQGSGKDAELICSSCTRGDGSASESPKLLLQECAAGESVGNKDGQLICVEGKLSLEEAKARAEARLKQRQKEELTRVGEEAQNANEDDANAV